MCFALIKHIDADLYFEQLDQYLKNSDLFFA